MQTENKKETFNALDYISEELLNAECQLESIPAIINMLIHEYDLDEDLDTFQKQYLAESYKDLFKILKLVNGLVNDSLGSIQNAGSEVDHIIPQYQEKAC